MDDREPSIGKIIFADYFDLENYYLVTSCRMFSYISQKE